MIFHRAGDSVVVCHVDHHDKAYAWAANRRLEVHPTTGAAQLLVLREKVVEVPVVVEVEAEAPRPFAETAEETLLKHGVPPALMDAGRATTEAGLYDLIDDLPEEAAEALLLMAEGLTPPEPVLAGEDGVSTDPYEHPDARRRFALVASDAEVQRAIDGGSEDWTVFLHPEQRLLAEQAFNGPARAVGSAGTGKTVVALHRAAALARRGEAGVLLCTFSPHLARARPQVPAARPRRRGPGDGGGA